MNLASIHRVSFKLESSGHRWSAKLLYFVAFAIFNSSVPPTVQIGEGTRFAYGGIGVVVHGRAIVGANCTIGQGVTIGGRSRKKEVPVIGDNVYLSAGCRVLGPVRIGSNAIIGANAVVLADVPANSISVGVPARVIRLGIEPSDYI